MTAELARDTLDEEYNQGHLTSTELDAIRNSPKLQIYEPSTREKRDYEALLRVAYD